KGGVFPVVTAGRAPRAADEIALGALTLRTTRKRVGDRLTISAGGPPRTFTITARVVLTPTVVNDSVPLGEAAIVTPAGLHALGADDPGTAPVNVFLLRLKPGVDHAAAIKRLRQVFPGTVLPAVRPPDVENLQRVDHL